MPAWMEIENWVWSGFGLNSRDLDRFAVADVLQRAILSLRRQASAQAELVESIVMASPHVSTHNRKQFFARLKVDQRRGVIKQSFFEIATHEEKLRMIGADLEAVPREKWGEYRRLQKQIEWLELNGYSVEEAMAVSRQWTQRAIDTGFFETEYVTSQGEILKPAKRPGGHSGAGASSGITAGGDQTLVWEG